MEEIIDIIFSKLVYSHKLIIIKIILSKIVHGDKLLDNERKFENNIKKHIVYMKDVFPDTRQETDIKKSIYGFIIQNENKLELFILNSEKEFEKNFLLMKECNKWNYRIIKKVFMIVLLIA